MEKVLIVEDDEGISDFVKLELEHEGYSTCLASTGRMALEVFVAEKPDLILLDIMLPELSGLEVLRRIRKESNVPVIILTARGETYDKVNGLNAGADDYLAKPFSIEELLARMSAVLRRSSAPAATSLGSLKIRGLELSPESMSASLNGSPIEFSKTEFLMLKNLMEHKGQVLSRDRIITKVWSYDFDGDDRVVDNHIKKLRQALGDESKRVKTIFGRGYKLTEK